ncbi:MAG: phospho-N-acetylmuramoyl-pentapeptide-transferase [Bacteroidia bacterium]|jgi:phospho-N-acetylmuramoyl-pentapeptide-transferase|nr:phospho-N-acetylmuramoyl-pentapeptide-transferase [Bacteroidia bacterium]
MLYYLFDWLNQSFDFPGAGVFRYISFRAAMSVITSLIITVLFGKRLIRLLQKKQVGETIRDLGLQGQNEKQGTPTMGGLIILSAIVIPTLLFAKLSNVYIILMLITTVWLGAIGFIDDYIKVFKKDKKGLHGKFKVMGQVGLGLIVGLTLYFSDAVVVREKISTDNKQMLSLTSDPGKLDDGCADLGFPEYSKAETKSLITTIPFVKNNEFDYNDILGVFGETARQYGWILFVLIVIFIITAVSNGANVTDGIDGLAAGTSAIIGVVLGILAYVSGNTIFADYLNIMYIPDTGELVIFIGAFVGACIGFLWYNAFPAQVFMGDTGSLALGGIIATFAIAIRKEMLIPIVCGIFLVENLSVVLQVAVFKYRKRKYGIDYARANRLFLMSPLHHHYQKKGFHESKIVTRFWIVGLLLGIVAIATLKLR